MGIYKTLLIAKTSVFLLYCFGSFRGLVGSNAAVALPIIYSADSSFLFSLFPSLNICILNFDMISPFHEVFAFGLERTQAKYFPHVMEQKHFFIMDTHTFSLIINKNPLRNRKGSSLKPKGSLEYLNIYILSNKIYVKEK